MKKWFFIQRWFTTAHVCFWEAEAKYATEEEISAFISRPEYKGHRSEKDILLHELSAPGEKIERHDLIEKAFRSQAKKISMPPAVPTDK
ncbi:MAG: hypothetical protein WC458_03360 [Patescibacteria group bacterium]